MKSYSNKQLKRLILSVIIVTIAAVSINLHLINTENIEQPKSNDLRVFTPDWGVGATLVEMGNPPIAIGDKRIYPVWVNTPKLPDSVLDIGIRGQPNTELLAQLQPDLIFNTFFYNHNAMFYDPKVPVHEVDFGFKDNDMTSVPKWSRFSEPTMQIGERLNKIAEAAQYIAEGKLRILQAGKTVNQYISKDKKILVIGFWDARQLRVASIDSPISLALQMMGYDLLSLGENSQWGITSVPMHTLYQLPDDVCLIINEPIPKTTKYEIAHSPIWQRSPFFKPDACIYKIDPVWTNGGIEVLASFAENLEKAVTTQNKNEFSYDFDARDSGMNLKTPEDAQ